MKGIAYVFFESQKDEIVNSIESLYLNHNFGTLSKSDFELLVFHYYMENLRSSGAEKTNYEIAKQLGVTVQRVAGLKDKEASRYSYDEMSWKKQFLKCVEKITVSGDRLVINITDRRLYRELESYLEKQGLGTEYDLNPSIFKADSERFITIIKQLYPDDYLLRLESELRNNISKGNNGCDKKEHMIEVAKCIGGFAASVLEAVISNKISGMV